MIVVGEYVKQAFVGFEQEVKSDVNKILIKITVEVCNDFFIVVEFTIFLPGLLQ